MVLLKRILKINFSTSYYNKPLPFIKKSYNIAFFDGINYHRAIFYLDLWFFILSKKGIFTSYRHIFFKGQHLNLHILDTMALNIFTQKISPYCSIQYERCELILILTKYCSQLSSCIESYSTSRLKFCLISPKKTFPSIIKHIFQELGEIQTPDTSVCTLILGK